MNQFFSSDNLVSIILFIAGYAFSAIYSYWRNQNGRWIVVEKVSESFILTKPPELKAKNAVEILAGNRPVDSLVQTQFLIRNTGADITDPVTIQLDFKDQKSGEIVNVFGVRAKSEYFDFGLSFLCLRRPFFNSSRAYKDVLRVSVYSEYPLTLQINGSGVGWKAKYIDKVQKQKTLLNSAIAIVGLGTDFDKKEIQKGGSGDEVWLGLG